MYGGKNIIATNIVFTNGVEDEWQWASIRQSHDGMVAIISNCTDCGHCVELYAPRPTDSAALTSTRVQVNQLFNQWINEHFGRTVNSDNQQTQELVHKRMFEVPSFIQEMLNRVHNQ